MRYRAIELLRNIDNLVNLFYYNSMIELVKNPDAASGIAYYTRSSSKYATPEERMLAASTVIGLIDSLGAEEGTFEDADFIINALMGVVLEKHLPLLSRHLNALDPLVGELIDAAYKAGISEELIAETINRLGAAVDWIEYLLVYEQGRSCLVQDDGQPALYVIDGVDGMINIFGDDSMPVKTAREKQLGSMIFQHEVRWEDGIPTIVGSQLDPHRTGSLQEHEHITLGNRDKGNGQFGAVLSIPSSQCNHVQDA